MANTTPRTLLRLTPRRLAILALYRENARGGDPHMGFVGIEEVQQLIAAGLVRPLNADEQHLQRRHTLTENGWTVLDAAEKKRGPVVAEVRS